MVLILSDEVRGLLADVDPYVIAKGGEVVLIENTPEAIKEKFVRLKALADKQFSEAEAAGL